MFSKVFYKLSVIVVLLIGFVYIYNASMAPDYKGSFPIKVIINDGDALPQVADKLYANNIIKSTELFRVIMGAVNLATDIRAGVYIFDNNITLWSVIEKFASRRPDKAVMSVTIPEGFNNEEIFERIIFYLPHLNREKFLKLAADKQGMLFPDTYFLQSSMSEESIIKLMHDEFLDKTAFLKINDTDLNSKGITGDNKKNLENNNENKKLKDTLIMASILEGESKDTGEEMKTIAGILYKRMQQGIKLQVDVARETYKINGLPKSPINNPGLASIEAAMHPIDSPYLYYLHSDDGRIHYAKTYRDHLLNIKKYLK